MGEANQSRKQQSTLERRNRFFTEQARKNLEEKAQRQAKAKKKASVKSRHGLKASPEPRPVPAAKPEEPPPTSIPCTIYFCQQAEQRDIHIAAISPWDESPLERLRVRHPAILAVIGNANLERMLLIRQHFARLLVEGSNSLFRADPELLNFIATHASPWMPPTRTLARRSQFGAGSAPKKPKAMLEKRTCKGCKAPFETKDKDLYCKECRKAMMARMKEEGFLTEIPWRNPFASRPVWDEGNPSFDNAVRTIEEAGSDGD
jgi:hypothetical protein